MNPARTAPTQPITFRALPAGLDTPCLVVDLDRLTANVAGLQDELDERGIALRPHVKTHKSVRIAGLQVGAGAAGLTVGTIGEAEVLAAAAIGDLFIAYPIWAAGRKAVRLRDLARSLPGLRVGVDSIAGAARLAAATGRLDRPLLVRIEIDPGQHRTGVAEPLEAVAVARAARDAGLDVEGVFSHGGHGYAPGAAESAGADEVRALTAAAEALEGDGFDVRSVSAGSTPTALSAATGRVNEVRAGTYVLGDRQQAALGAIRPDGCALAVAATVVSAYPERLVLDAGAKALTKDRPDWLPGFGTIAGYPDLVIERLSDYHGVTLVRAGSARPALGEVVAVIPNHACPVIDLFDRFMVVADDGSIETWPVDARGRSG